MNSLIVDDDVISQDIIESYSNKTSILKVIRKCSSADEASEALLNEKIDLMFLDVMMPDISGIDLLKGMNGDKPQVILMTSEKKFATEAFDLDATDFLLKPVTYSRFLKAVSKAKKRNVAETHFSRDENIFVKVNSRLQKIDAKDIYLIEALADYVALHTPLKKFIVHSSMKAIEEKLPDNEFLRIHNSFIARLDKITAIEDGTIVIQEKVVPVSRTHRKELMNRLKLL